MAKPDDRSDNAKKLRKMVNNTRENMAESQSYLAEHADEISAVERETLEAKNQRRKQSIEAFQEEIQDET
ncbi:small acid-soluble spore protein Tlp [Brevibacillus sp. TJ4]|uniref:small acid-soluble spore protein Tlp n=1 Tax=Brevibacillus sp. TJ4 TaxID=3234853 RepID=UPI003BA0C65B